MRFKNSRIFFNNNANSKKSNNERKVDNLNVSMSRIISANDEEIKASITPCIIAEVCNNFPTKPNHKIKSKESETKKSSEEIINNQLKSTDKLKLRKTHRDNETSTRSLITASNEQQSVIKTKNTYKKIRKISEMLLGGYQPSGCKFPVKPLISEGSYDNKVIIKPPVNIENIKDTSSELLSQNDHQCLLECPIEDNKISITQSSSIFNHPSNSTEFLTVNHLKPGQSDAINSLNTSKLPITEKTRIISPSSSIVNEFLNSSDFLTTNDIFACPSVINNSLSLSKVIDDNPNVSSYFVANDLTKLSKSQNIDNTKIVSPRSSVTADPLIDSEVLVTLDTDKISPRSSLIKFYEDLLSNENTTLNDNEMRTGKLKLNPETPRSARGFQKIPLKTYGMSGNKEENFKLPTIFEDVFNHVIKNELKDAVHVSTIKWKDEILTISSTIKECSLSMLDYGLWKNSTLSTVSSNSSEIELNESKITRLLLKYTKALIRRSFEMKDRTWSGNCKNPYIEHADHSYDGGYGFVDGVVNFQSLKKRKFSMKPETQRSRESFMALSHMFSYRKLVEKVDSPLHKSKNKFIPKKPKYRPRLFSESIEQSLTMQTSASLESFDEHLARKFTENNGNSFKNI